jgi:hypothetical protein
MEVELARHWIKQFPGLLVPDSESDELSEYAGIVLLAPSDQIIF